MELNKILENTGDMALKRRAKNIIDGLQIRPKDKILDIGCGDGYYLHILSCLGHNPNLLTGTDYDSKGLKKAKLNLSSKIKLSQGDLMEKLPFPNNYFDKAVMSEVAEHLPNDVKGLIEVKRILKKGGTLCLTVPNKNYPFLWDPLNWILERVLNSHVKSGFFAGIWNQHIRLYSVSDINTIVKQAGFEVVTSKPLTYWSLPFNHYLVNLVARYLHTRYQKGDISSALNKFNANPKKSIFSLAFNLVNLIDRLNDFFPTSSSGVAVFVKAIKP